MKKSKLRDGRAKTQKAILANDFTNPWAGLIFRWLLRQEIWDCIPQLRSLLDSPGLSDLGFTSTEKRKLEELIHGEEVGTGYSGPLLVSGGVFSFDSAWPETPPLFRFIFKWVTSEFEFWRSGAISPLEHIGLTSAQIEGLPDDRELLGRIQNLFDSHDILAVPRILFSKTGKQRILRGVRDFLEEREGRGQIVSGHKTFLGTPQEWDVFLFCYPLIDQTTGLGKPKAIRAYINSQKERTGSGTEWRTIVRDRYSTMRLLMEACWPSFGPLVMILIHTSKSPIRGDLESVTLSLLNNARRNFGGVSPLERLNLKITSRMMQKVRALDSWRRTV